MRWTIITPCHWSHNYLSCIEPHPFLFYTYLSVCLPFFLRLSIHVFPTLFTPHIFHDLFDGNASPSIRLSLLLPPSVQPVWYDCVTTFPQRIDEGLTLSCSSSPAPCLKCVHTQSPLGKAQKPHLLTILIFLFFMVLLGSGLSAMGQQSCLVLAPCLIQHWRQ